MSDEVRLPPGDRRDLGLPATRGMRLALVAVLGAGILLVAIRAAPPQGRPARASPIHEAPVLAGRFLWGACSAGFHARLGAQVVVTTSGHCSDDGVTATDDQGRTIGVFGPAARSGTCDQPRHTCRPSDMAYLVIAADRIPWGRLNLVDMGAGGYRAIRADATALDCAAIGLGDAVEINGRDRFRSGVVAEKGPYVHDPAADGVAFPCMAAARISVSAGDSGAAVLVRGLPGGVVSRGFGGVAGALGLGGAMGFTPLAEGLANLGLELCATPDCGLAPPA